MKKIISIISLLLPYYALASDSDVGIGFSASWTKSPYIGESNEFSVMPLVDFDSTYFFMSGTSGGLHLWQTDNQQLNLSFEYQSFELKPSDSNDWRVQQLDRRKSTLLAGLAYAVITPYGQLSAEAQFDTLNNSHGLSIDLEYAGYVKLGEKLSLIPQLGVTWYNHKYNDYYFGVSEQESIRSGFTSYRAGSGFMPYLTLTSIYDITPHWSAVFEYEFNLLSHDVKSSPIVDSNNTNSISAGLLYYF